MSSTAENTEQPSVEIIIVGGGIIGVILALGLLKRNVKVKIFEQARSFREIGAGVAFTACAVRCMGIIEPGIVKAMEAVASANGDGEDPNDWLRWVDGYNQHNKEDPYDEKLLFKLYAGYKGFGGCHRAHFLDELVKIVPEGVVEFRKRLDTISEQKPGEKLVLTFEDGTSATADAIIGCDGIKSRVRQIILGKDNPASYSHYSHKFAFRGIIPMDKAVKVLGDFKARNQSMHIGPKAHILHYPIAGQKMINLSAFVTDPNEWSSDDSMVVPATRAEVEEVFAGWGPTVRDLTSLLPAELDKWALFDSFDHPAPFYNRGRICLAGDAAHASSPHHGAGAGIGVEDALCLSTLLERAVKSLRSNEVTKDEALSLAFDTFNDVRRERSQWLVNSSRIVCDVYQWQIAELGDDAEKCFKEIEWRSHKIWNFDIDGMLKETTDGYEKRLKTVEGITG